MELVLDAERQPRPSSEAGPHVECQIQIEECLQSLLPEVSAVTAKHGPLKLAAACRLNNCLEFVSVFPYRDRQAKLCDTSGVFVELAAADQLPQLEASAEKQADCAAVIEALSRQRSRTRQQQTPQQSDGWTLGATHSSGPIETARDPTQRMQSRGT